MENLMLLVLGVFGSILGIVNIYGNISAIHSYNRRKVKEEDIPKYGRTVGIGTLIISTSFIISFGAAFWREAVIPYIMIPAIVIGLTFVLYGQIKYNHGIF